VLSEGWKGQSIPCTTVSRIIRNSVHRSETPVGQSQGRRSRCPWNAQMEVREQQCCFSVWKACALEVGGAEALPKAYAITLNCIERIWSFCGPDKGLGNGLLPL